jgi:antitoxin (DNA-binding transcriptional repressor) of toxin-antitoxin stability system
MTITIDDARARLPELIANMRPGESAVIISQGQPIATLTRSPGTDWPCQAGSAKQLPHWMAPDFDAPLDDFREYME